MKRVMSHMVILIYMVCALSAMTGCTLRELTYDYHPFCTVDLEVDWSRAGEVPTGMTAIFYPVSTDGEPIIHTTHDVVSTKVSLREGIYNVILFSYSPSEYGTIGFRGLERYETAEIYALEPLSETSSWYSKAEGEKVVVEPEPVSVATIEGFEVTQEMIEAEMAAREAAKAEAAGKKSAGVSGSDSKGSGTKAYISLSPKNIIADGKIIVHVDGISNLRSVRGSISGMAEGFMPATFTATESHVTHLLDTHTWEKVHDADNGANGFITTGYSTFGMPGMQITRAEGKSSSGIMLHDAVVQDRELWEDAVLRLVITLVNSEEMEFSFNVGESVDISEETGEVVVHIEVTRPEPDPDRPDEQPEAPIVLPDVKPDDGGTGGGFDVSIGDWGENVNVDVEFD